MKTSFLSSPRALFTVAALSLAPLAAFAQQTITATPGQVGVAYSYQVNSTATGTLTYSATGLPAGLAINTSSGRITGIPTIAGTTTGTVSITTVASGFVNSANLVITISPVAGAPAITSGTTASGAVGAPFSHTITASNSPTSFNVGALPAGLLVNSTTGAITSTNPSAAGTFPVVISANNAAGTGAPITLTITIAPAAAAPVINSAATASSLIAPYVVSYQITATNTPTSYTASGLPLGLALNATGLISGTATVPGVYAVSLTATGAGGTSAPFALTLTVGGVPAIGSATSASGTINVPFSYTITASNTPTSFNVGALPAGLSGNTTTGVIGGTPTTAGVTSLTVSANNATGTGAAVTLVITINPPPPVSGGGGGPAIAAPTISTQPVSQSVAVASSVTFSVSAIGTGLSFQWSKGGVPITGAQSAAYTIASVATADAGTYSVLVSTSGGSVESAAATLTVVTAPPSVVAPAITTQPVAASVTAGGSASFSVAASGTTPLTYQWLKDGTAIAGATAATLSLNAVTLAQAGSYSVVVTNSAGSKTSNGVALAVTPPPPPAIAGTYFGSFANNGGSFGLLVRADRTGVFLGFANAAKVTLFSRDLVVDATGRFSVTQRGAPAAQSTSTPPTAAAEGDITISGAIAADGTVSGTVSSLNLTFSAPAAVTGATSAVAGLYQSGAAGSSAQSLALVGPAGDALVVVNISGAGADGGRGTVTAGGAIAVTTAANATVTGSISAAAGTIALTSGTTTYAGSTDNRNEKLINISTRSLTGTAADTLIAGFVITGTESKPVLVRAIGPTLATFGVNGALSAVRLEVFRGSTSVAVGTDWGVAANNPAEISTTAARVGAFALPANSRDASLLLNLTPGNYSAVVTGQGGASGVALVEVYDATAGAIPPAQRVVNIATRATAGTSDNTLIAGFYVSGKLPKRVLIRGIGPSLAQFSVTGALARPQLSVASGATVLAQNAGVATSADAAAIADASAQVGAFALAANAQDAAILINLAPGAYTAQIVGVGATTGVALIEVYEVP